MIGNYMKQYLIHFKKNFLIYTILFVLFNFILIPFLYSLPKYYKSEIKIIPKAEDIRGGMISQMIKMVQPGMSDKNLDIYLLDIISSNEFIKEILDSKYILGEDSVLIEDIENVKVETTQIYWEKAETEFLINRFKNNYLIYDELDNGIILIGVSSIDPHLSKQILDKILVEINKYYDQLYLEELNEEKKYLSIKLNEVKDSLEVYENKLLKLYHDNPLMNMASKIKVKELKLQKKIEFLNSLNFEFKKQFELVKLRILQNENRLDLVNNPDIIAIPYKPKRKILFVFSNFIIFGLILLSSFLIINKKNIFN